jgi:AcrR family transcriptional regulator
MNVHSAYGGIEVTTNKKEDIMQASLMLFTERGFDATTVPMIAEKAQVGAGTIYRYFENKEVLLNSLFRECVGQIIQALSDGFPESASVREQFHHIFHRLTRFGQENNEALTFIDSHMDPRLLDEKSQSKFVELLDFLRRFLKRGQQQGIIVQLPPDALIPLFYGPIVKLFLVIRDGDLKQTDELFAGVEECCWNALKVH